MLFRLTFNVSRLTRLRIPIQEKYILMPFFWITSILSDKYWGKLVWHTGHAYSRTGVTTLTCTLTRSFCVIPARFNWYNMYKRLPAFFTCLFHVRSWEMVTPNSLAWQTCAISLPSIFTFGIMLLKLLSCAKLMIICFDFSELIFMSFCSVHLAAISTDFCIKIHNFCRIFQITFCHLHTYVMEQ